MMNYLISKSNRGTRAENFGLKIFSLLLFLTFNFPLVASAATIKAPPSNLGLVGYWPMNEGSGTIAGDFSGRGHTGTFVSTPTWITGKRGSALSFDSSKYVTAVAHSDFAFGTGDFTVSAWVKFDSFGARRAIWEAGPSGSSGIPTLWLDTDKTLLFYAHGVGTIASYAWSSAVANTWYQVVVSRSGTTLNMYINGQSVITPVTNSTNFTQNGFALGYLTTPNYLLGSLDDVRIYNRALTASEITTLYRAGETRLGVTTSSGSLSNGLVGHWTFDGKHTNWTSPTAGTATDFSGQGNTGTFTNMSQTASPTRGVIGQGMSFDGVDDYVNVPGAFSNNLGPVTYSVWIYMRSYPNVNGAFLFSKSFTRYFRVVPSNNRLTFFVDFDGATDLSSNSVADVIPFNSWTHVALTWDGSATATNVHMYVNGTETAYGTVTNGTGSQVSDSGVSQVISSDSRQVDGYLDDVRIYNRALTQAEITRLYNMGRPSTITGQYALDKVQNATVAYSVRKLRSVYTGNALEVRRASDSATQDIGFNGSNLDTTTLSSFCASTDCFVRTWYDQSGNGRNLTQTTTTLQPKIVSSGTIYTEAGKVYFQTDGTDDYLITSNFGLVHPSTYFVVFNNVPSVNHQYDALVEATNSTNDIALLLNNDTTLLIWTDVAGAVSATIASNTRQLASAKLLGSGAGSTLRINNNTESTGSPTNANPNGIIIGKNNFGGSPGQFRYSELIVYSGAQSSDNQTKIRNDINRYYKIW